MKKKIGLALLLLVGLPLALVGWSVHLSNAANAEKEQVRQEMLAHLEGHYGIEFEVGKPYTTGEGPNGLHYEATAHPKELPELTFQVSDGKKRSGSYDDYYLTKRPNYLGRIEVEKKIREVYGTNADVRVGYEFDGGGYKEKDWSFAQLFEQSRQKGGDRIALRYEVFMEPTAVDKAIEAKKAYQIIKNFVLDSGTKKYSVRIILLDKADKEDFLKHEQRYCEKIIKSLNGGSSYSPEKEREIAAKKIIAAFWFSSEQEKPISIQSDKDLLKQGVFY